MRTLTQNEHAVVGGGNPLIGVVALAAVAAWIWTNRDALNEIAQSTALTAADLDAECAAQAGPGGTP